MLSNAYFLAKFRFYTAENEPAKNLQKIAKFANFAPSPPIPSPEVVVLGSGGREHALALTLAKSSRVSSVICVPGNGACRSGQSWTQKKASLSGAALQI